MMIRAPLSGGWKTRCSVRLSSKGYTANEPPILTRRVYLEPFQEESAYSRNMHPCSHSSCTEVIALGVYRIPYTASMASNFELLALIGMVNLSMTIISLPYILRIFKVKPSAVNASFICTAYAPRFFYVTIIFPVNHLVRTPYPPSIME